MSNAFTRGLRRLFGIKPKRRLAPYGSITRPRLLTEEINSHPSFEEVLLENPVVTPEEIKPVVKKKKVAKKKSVRRSTPPKVSRVKKKVKKKVAKKSRTKKKK